MTKPVFNPDHKRVLDSFLLNIPGVVPGKMFGYPAYYINKKLFACVYGTGVGIKVPASVAEKLVGAPGIVPFQPMGRPQMKEWIQINRDTPEAYATEKDIFETSIGFVMSRYEGGK